MRSYLRDLQTTHSPKDLFSLMMGLVSVFMVIKQFAAAGKRVREHRLNTPTEISQ